MIELLDEKQLSFSITVVNISGTTRNNQRGLAINCEMLVLNR